ncbi:MAG: glycine dehydrogenase (aminomethyl-transferring) [Ignavibacteriae bacterium HGW-Ignavibacteriae-1]|jgi:glycine dehydrogenase subunit 2|nr:MAG: glycine dehydrogenase (aminomethyl-transferring) [Ignavibacteriae bacterium HGW-Ignavibacteriae-1]
MEKIIIEKSRPGRRGYSLPKLDVGTSDMQSSIPETFLRKEAAKLPEIAEIEVARHFGRLSHLNYNIEQGLYPLGSCTMKYNPKINETVASMSGFADLHPNSTDEMSQGALEVMYKLGEVLKEISGMQGVSLQPAAGSQGELTGILMFRAYHKHRNDTKRTKILIPNAAHGTNPASAAIAGFEIVEINSNAEGMVDIEDLRSKIGDDVAGFMLTNPNTVGIFEKEIETIAELIRGCGGLMYMDGANLNALLGIARPGDMGFDCVHINLHKTFSTPHGGGGPGSGPVCVSERLIPYLPIPQISKNNDKYKLDFGKEHSIGRVHTFFGNFGMFIRAYTYISMHGNEALRQISENAIINSNYLRALIKDNYKIPYTEFGMHEFVISADYQKEMGVSAKDIAKRLLDYGFHAPTIYFPLIVHECMLIEPTETESKENIEQFADVMNKIAQEARENPELITSAPLNTPIRRVDDALAARKLNIRW